MRDRYLEKDLETDVNSQQETMMMNRHVNAISGRLSLRSPQRISLEVVHRITEIAPPGKDADTTTLLEAIQSEFASVTDLEREFPSFAVEADPQKASRILMRHIEKMRKALVLDSRET